MNIPVGPSALLSLLRRIELKPLLLVKLVVVKNTVFPLGNLHPPRYEPASVVQHCDASVKQNRALLPSPMSLSNTILLLERNVPSRKKPSSAHKGSCSETYVLSYTGVTHTNL